MQEERRKVIGDFSDLLSEEIKSCVETDVSIGEFQKYKNILIVRSAKNAIFHAFIEKLMTVNPQCKVNILGGALDRKFLDSIVSENDGFSYRHYIYDGRFDVNRMGEFKNAIMAENQDLDCIVFLNYYPHTERYINIEEVVNFFAKDNNLPIYSYTDFGDVFKYVDIETHFQTISLYVQLVRWFHI